VKPRVVVEDVALIPEQSEYVDEPEKLEAQVDELVETANPKDIDESFKTTIDEQISEPE
tara:strand:+ start:398 stop:574 length:177 start_codon:yes stop_codon:yes gene_type:complete